MAEALESGKVAAYVTDFANPAVVKMERAIVIPHLGASTAEAEDNCAKMAVGGSRGLPRARREDPLREYVATR
ncbi:MAG: hypothetical protein ACLTDR_04345 [Adlercreutzia equolifaciens]